MGVCVGLAVGVRLGGGVLVLVGDGTGVSVAVGSKVGVGSGEKALQAVEKQINSRLIVIWMIFIGLIPSNGCELFSWRLY